MIFHMKIKVVPYVEAIKLEPRAPTYAIRIFGTKPESKIRSETPLPVQGNWVRIRKYEFDDLTSYESGQTLFGQAIAREIISDFRRYQKECEELVVHCFAGRSRSPAVAIALNEIFDLGYDPRRMKSNFPKYNRFVYLKMMAASKSLAQYL